MTPHQQGLIDTAQALVADDKGILAMDESNGTCDERFTALGIPQTLESRRAYRELLVLAGRWIGLTVIEAQHFPSAPPTSASSAALLITPRCPSSSHGTSHPPRAHFGTYQHSLLPRR
ncbi:MAG: hypothetical protein RL015_1796 [Verrucomicrobiota bacterium]|jgi:hypothetical protein